MPLTWNKKVLRHIRRVYVGCVSFHIFKKNLAKKTWETSKNLTNSTDGFQVLRSLCCIILFLWSLGHTQSFSSNYTPNNLYTRDARWIMKQLIKTVFHIISLCFVGGTVATITCYRSLRASMKWMRLKILR